MKKDLYNILLPPLSFACAILMTIVAGSEMYYRKGVEQQLKVKEKEIRIYSKAAVNAITLLELHIKLNDADGTTDKMLYLCNAFTEYQNQRMRNAKTDNCD